jgi:hypothetical protein
MINNSLTLAAIEAVNQGKQVLKPIMKSAIGRNFLTPFVLGSWKVVHTPYAIEVSKGTYPDGSDMYGLTVFRSNSGNICQNIGKACDVQTFIESLKKVVTDTIAFHQSTKTETQHD